MFELNNKINMKLPVELRVLVYKFAFIIKILVLNAIIEKKPFVLCVFFHFVLSPPYKKNEPMTYPFPITPQGPRGVLNICVVKFSIVL